MKKAAAPKAEAAKPKAEKGETTAQLQAEVAQQDKKAGFSDADRAAVARAGKALTVRDPKTPPPSPYMAETRGLGNALMAAIADPSFGADKAREVFNFYKDVRAYESEQAFTVDFNALQKDLSHIRIRADRKIEIRAKDARTGERTGPLQQSTPYATYAAIMQKVLPLLNKHNFTISAETEPGPTPDRLIVRGTLQHITGHKRQTIFPLPIDTSGSKNNIQGWGSAQQYGRRYAVIALCNIVSQAPEDADTDGHEGDFKPNVDGSLTDVSEPEKVSEEQAAQLRKKIGDVKLPMDKFRQKYGIDNVADLPANRFAGAMKALDDYAKGAKQNG